jgi:hypothetical protein
MCGIFLVLGAVGMLSTGFGLVWMFCPAHHDWMESPRDRFLEQQGQFPPVTRY